MYDQQLGRPTRSPKGPAIGLPFSPPKQHRSMAYNATNRGSQKATWESDIVIVPMIPGNAGVGKDGTQKGPVQGTHLLYTGIGERNGNETEQDKGDGNK